MPSASRPAAVYLATGSIFAAMAARGLLLPLRVNELGGDKLQVGLLFSVFTVTAAGLSLPAGFLADRFGRRSLVLFSILSGGAAQLGTAPAGSVEPMYAWQALGGVGGGACQAALFAALADAAPGHRLGRSMGWLTLAMQTGFLVGPAVAGVSLQWLNLQQVLAASTALFCVALVAALAGISPTSRAGEEWKVVAPLRDIVRQRGFLAVTVGLLGATMLWGTLQAYLPLFGKEQLGLPAAQIGYVIAIQAVINGLARVPGGWLVDRMRRRGGIIIVGITSFAVCLAILPHLTGFWDTAGLLLVSVPLLATVYVALTVVFSNLATEETRGVSMGIYGTILYLGMGLGPAAFGAVMEKSGYGAGFTACAVTGLVFAGLVAVLRRQPGPAARRARSLPSES